MPVASLTKLTKQSIFKSLFDRQVKYQSAIDGEYNETDRLKMDRLVLDHLHNAIEEIIEARQEINVRKKWNPQKRDKPADQSAVLEEITDVIFFLMNAAIYTGASFEDLEAMIEKKIEKNDTRNDHIKV